MSMAEMSGGQGAEKDAGDLAEVLAVHQLHSSLNVCLCGTWRAMAGAGPLIDQHRDHLAAALLASSAMADLKARWQGEALLAGWLAEGLTREDRRSLAAIYGYEAGLEDGLAEGEARVRARVEAVLDECDRRTTREPDRVLTFWVRRLRATLDADAAETTGGGA